MVYVKATVMVMLALYVGIIGYIIWRTWWT